MYVGVGIRILLGCFFIFSGFEKLITPYQNFLYVVQSYAFLPSLLEIVAARMVPWVELVLGAFLILGLWLNYVLPSLLVLIASFILIVSQALVRDLPILECGCFGESFSLPLSIVMIIDSMLLLLTYVLFRNISQVRKVSLDEYFE